MMKIEIKNSIRMDGQSETILENHEAELTLKGDYVYLVYQNEEAEKVVLKFNDRELVMTRFSTPNTILRFQKEGFGLAQIATPMGQQKLLTKTHAFEADKAKAELALSYDLLMGEDDVLASYDLTVKVIW